MKTIATQCGLCSAPLTLDVPDIVQQGAVFAMCPACQQQDHIEAGGLITGLVEPIVGKLAIRRVETTPGAVTPPGIGGPSARPTPASSPRLSLPAGAGSRACSRRARARTSG
jgi:hypothetical protein